MTGTLAGISGPGDVRLSLKYDGSLLTGETWAGPILGTVANTFDNNFFLIARSINDTTINYQLDSDGLLMQAGTLAITRDGQGLPTGTTIDNITDAWGYDSLGQETTYSATLNGSPLYSVQYARDTLGRVTQQSETIQGVSNNYTYTYDGAGQLSSVAVNGAVTSSYSYDANGNRLSFTGASGPINGQYDAQDRLIRYGTASYGYRDDGQLIGRAVDGQGTTQYQYDALGRLLGVTSANGTQIDYLLDGRGRRVAKKVNGVIVRGWLYQDDLRPVAELDGSNNVVSVFVYMLPGGPPAYMINNGSTYRIISDELGSARLVVDT
jgi:YD repeat-containing protein